MEVYFTKHPQNELNVPPLMNLLRLNFSVSNGTLTKSIERDFSGYA